MMDPAALTDLWARAILPDAGRLRRDWTFTSSPPSLRTRLLRRAAAKRARPFPGWQLLRAPTPATRWNCLFLFAPTGTLDAIQQRLLTAVRALRGALLVVVALPDGARVPPALSVADALARKDPAGFDFSAYRIALALVAEHSPGALAYLQNDSVFGPLGDLDATVEEAPWDFTGFIGSPVVENHLSSFAFAVRGVTPARLAALEPALPGDRCFDGFEDVVLMQETRLARMAARSGSVGGYWYVDDAPPEPSPLAALRRRIGLADRGPAPFDLRADPMLGMPRALIDQGFPFAKRSLFGKYAGSPDAGRLAALLAARDWPVVQP